MEPERKQRARQVSPTNSKLLSGSWLGALERHHPRQLAVAQRSSDASGETLLRQFEERVGLRSDASVCVGSGS